MTDVVCWRCMKRAVPKPLDECSYCIRRELRNADYRLNHSSHQQGKVTSEATHERHRAPSHMINVAEQGGYLKEMDWGWEYRTKTGQRPNYRGVS